MANRNASMSDEALARAASERVKPELAGVALTAHRGGAVITVRKKRFT
jgi:hypothetical protein